MFALEVSKISILCFTIIESSAYVLGETKHSFIELNVLFNTVEIFAHSIGL